MEQVECAVTVIFIASLLFLERIVVEVFLCFASGAAVRGEESPLRPSYFLPASLQC